MSSLMAFGCTFSLLVFMLVSIYRGLNGFTNFAKSLYLWSYLPGHYHYEWLAHHFKTHHVLQLTRPSPLIVRYFGS